MFEPSVGFDIQMVRGFRNILFGGEGLFLATLTGPGHVWLQSMPILNLAEEIARYLPGGDTGANSTAGTLGTAAALGAAGGQLGGLFGGSES
jgi:biogenesis AIM24-like protein